MAYRAVANDQLAAGEFAEALVTCQDAAAKGVPKSVMARPHCQSLAALGRLNDAVTIAEERAFRSSEDFGITDRAFLLVAVGRRGDAESILTLASGAVGPVTRETQAAQRAVSWLIACCLGVPEVPADFDPSKPNAIAFDVGLVTKNFELAKSSIRAGAEAQNFNYSAWSLLAVAAGAAKNENVLRESAAQMAEVLTKVPTPAMHGIGQALETDPQSAMDWVRRSPVDASQRAILYAAIGFLHPSHRAECFALAAKHNYWPDKYQKLLDAWLKAARE
jgi:hypothetical protein